MIDKHDSLYIQSYHLYKKKLSLVGPVTLTIGWVLSGGVRVIIKTRFILFATLPPGAFC